MKTLLIIILLSLTSCVIAQDSIKFSYPETKALINSYVNYPILKQISDNKDIIINSQEIIIANDSIKLNACESSNKAQDSLIKGQEAVIKDEAKMFRRERLSKRLWQYISAGLGIVLIYEVVK